MKYLKKYNESIRFDIRWDNIKEYMIPFLVRLKEKYTVTKIKDAFISPINSEYDISFSTFTYTKNNNYISYGGNKYDILCEIDDLINDNDSKLEDDNIKTIAIYIKR